MSVHIKQKPAIERRNKILSIAFNKTLLIRIAISIVLFGVAALFEIPQNLKIILLVFSYLFSGCDIAYKAFCSFFDNDLFTTSIVLTIITLISFATGFSIEAVLMIVLYQFGRFIISVSLVNAKKNALNIIEVPKIKEELSIILNDNSIGDMDIEKELKKSVKLPLNAIYLIGIAYATMITAFAHYNILVSIHRALVMFVIATPASILISIPTVGLYGLCACANNGLIFKNAKALELLNTDVDIDQSVFKEVDPITYININPESISEETFLNFIVHMVCNSKQSFARMILNEFPNITFSRDLIKEFRDFEGLGVYGKINNFPVYFGNSSMLASIGIKVPESNNIYYLYLGDKYVGNIEIVETNSANTDDDTFFEISRRVDAVSIENAFIAFTLKCLLLIFTIIGYCNLWIAIIGDILISVFTIRNAKRVCMNSNFDYFFINKI